jgi:Flp pilus assembly protein TadG
MTTMRTNITMPQAKTAEQAQSQKGSVLVEFAFILPVFLLLLFGVISFSIALYDKTVLTMATREGARAGAKYVANKTPDERGAIACNIADLACQSSLISFGSDMTPIFSYTINNNILTVSTNNVTYTGLYIFPELPISSKSSMRLE